MNDPDVNVPILVKSLRERMRMTQEQFAREIGVSFATVNSWENGKRHPQPFLLKRLIELDRGSSRKTGAR